MPYFLPPAKPTRGRKINEGETLAFYLVYGAKSIFLTSFTTLQRIDNSFKRITEKMKRTFGQGWGTPVLEHPFQYLL